MPYEAIDHWSRLHERDDLSSVGQSGLSPAIDSWLYRILERNLRAFVDHHSLRRPPPDSAFEIGAGTGYWVGSWRAAGVARVDGCDLVPADVDRLQARHGTTGYRHGVKELAYSRATPLIDGLRARGARVLAYDPLLSVDEITRAGAEPWRWGSPSPDVRVIITQTGDPAWLDLDPAWFPGLRVVYDGRNSLAPLVERLGPGVAYRGVGVPDDRRSPVAVD